MRESQVIPDGISNQQKTGSTALFLSQFVDNNNRSCVDGTFQMSSFGPLPNIEFP
jgi:hypothetical protein